ncbi:hypothetical protein [Williamsia deligens]|uniref:Glycine zipper n=2 Tax=Williamsia deligens TaxID=321325 RepID=A0ABW3G4C8_9NOCA|nr:hypothetical protein [Williamsia deligens]
MTKATAGVVLAAALASAAAGQAAAAPAPGTAPPGSAPPSNEMAPGIAPATPAPAPAPTAPQGRSIIPAPTYDAPVIYEDSPEYTPPVYSGAYNPVPPVITAPRRVAPVNPILPRPGTIKLGNFRAPQPAWLSDADARNLNGQAATIEARTATYYESIGFPKDQAARTAASTTVGILVGGATGAAIGAVPGAIIGLPVGAGVGAIAGAITGGVISGGALAGPGAGVGALVGLGVGPVAGAAGGGALGALIGGGIGGAIGYAVGAGDPGGDPNAPLGGATNEDPRKSKPAPPNPDANQYELHLDRKGLPGGGKIDYVVAKNGDVRGQVAVGPIDAPIVIDHDGADAPYKAAGVFAQTARDSVNAAVINFGREAQRAFPGLQIDYPQYASASVGGKHRK